ncbi:T9SS C-terminal target domain-containing protein [candidate division KSB1 bacterium]|nr:MAG: T9SS C-terminal target domain-containing protein [candidate division KSB1 bacterium]
MLACITLNRGTYFLVVEAGYPQGEGYYQLHISACSDPCQDNLFAEGTSEIQENLYRYVQTVDANSPDSLYHGPWPSRNPCQENGGWYGFDYLSWYDNDFGWRHTWPGYNSSSIQSVDSAFVYICSWDVDNFCDMSPNRVTPVSCEKDIVFIDEQMPNRYVEELAGSNQALSITKIPFYLSDITEDGNLFVGLDIDYFSHWCNWAVNVHRSQLVVYYRENRPPFVPVGIYPACVTGDSDLCVTVTGPDPADPDGDPVNHVYHWYLYDAELSDWVFQSLYTDRCVPASETTVGQTWKVEVVAIDNHSARSDPWTVTFNVVFDCGSNPVIGWDYGDHNPQCYPTEVWGNGGPANAISELNIAWLGETVTADVFPNSVNLDEGDDGVVFVDSLNWMPCDSEEVDVTITTGPGFNPEIHSLYLYGWKDGDYPANCSFSDRHCDGTAYECIIRGAQITDMAASQSRTIRFRFKDPGVLLGQGRYDGIFRFRLLSEYMACDAAIASVDRILGETEDYIKTDLQLPVQLLSFEAVQENESVLLRWSTASESNNDYFRIERRSGDAWRVIATRIDGAGNSTTANHYNYRDASVEPGTTYEYRLISVDFNGTAQVVSTNSIPVVQRDPQVVEEYKLYPNYPNPFNPTTTITFDIKESGNVSLRVFDVVGREVAVLADGFMNAGRHHAVFNAEGMPTGLYIYKISTNGYSATQKMILLK